MALATAQTASLSREIVRSVRRFTSASLTPELVEKVQIGLLDFLSCAFAARELPWGDQAIRVASRAAGGSSTIIGTDFRVAPGEAAFANAVLGHGLVREDMHTGAVSHLGVVIYPVLLALAQEHRATGIEFIRAAVCGYEVGATVGRALMDAEMVRRFRPTGITGPLAGAVAGGLLLGLDEDALVSALGLAANTTAGLNEWPYSGGDDMFFHPGFAARSAVTSVELAACGARASETALDGRSGLFTNLGKRGGACFSLPSPEILSVYYKPAPACNYAQTACQAALALAQRVQAPEITEITVKLPAAAVHYPGCNYAGPFERVLQSKMSVQYCVAATLVHRAIEESNYRLPADPEVTRLAAITRLEIDPQLTKEYPRQQGADLAVQLRDGSVLRERMDDVRPATASQIRDRFRAAAGASAETIEEIVSRLRSLEDISGLAGLLGRS